MAASFHIVRGPVGAGKTARLCQLWSERAQSAPGTALWLGPTRRAIEVVRVEFDLWNGGDATRLIFAFPDFLSEVVKHNDSRVHLLPDVQRRLLVEDLLARLQSRGGIGYFNRVLETRGFGEGLLGLLEELQRAGVSPADFTAKAESNEKLRQCAALYEGYSRELKKRALLDRESQPWHARDLLRSNKRLPFTRVQSAFIDGFTDFTPAQLGVLEVMGDWLQEIWISLPDEPESERSELFARPRQTAEVLARFNPREEWIASSPAVKPAGLAHLARQLFRPLRRVEAGSDTTGIELIEAPGVIGEARLVARRIKTLLLEGASPEQMLVTARDLPGIADGLIEVFAEYEIPVDVEGTDPLTRAPAVAFLLRAIRLPDDDWPFAAVTAVLRNNYFRPRWPETLAQPELPGQAEALLRSIGHPRGRDGYLAAVKNWAEKPEDGLEDEQAEESRRQRIHDSAKVCLAFLNRFFGAWDRAPSRATVRDHASWLRAIAEDLGVIDVSSEDANDMTALELFWSELDTWQKYEPTAILDRKTFLRRLMALVSAAGIARSERGMGRVRVLTATQARHVEADHVFILGLGERSFPRLSLPTSLFEDEERQALQSLGLPQALVTDLLPDEMLLFYQIVTRARRSLVMSYPAVDARGQALLPSSFLSAALQCFEANSVKTERRNMLIEGYNRDTPLSASERRIRAAGTWKTGGSTADLPGDLHANLTGAAELERQRFHEHEHTPFDGRFRDPRIIAEVAQRFGPARIYSPTALEDYIACPFKFFLKHALRLEPLEDPKEDIEVTRRGQAVHRALARLHENLKVEGIDGPSAVVTERMCGEMNRAVEEYVERAPSPAGKKLWTLEGERLQRMATRYVVQWGDFVEPWNAKGVSPRPEKFEVDFGLPAPAGMKPLGPLVIRIDDVEVRISGRIDRVDVANLPDGSVGFWIIDYKTGRVANYTGSDLQELRKLQLTLYALAVEDVLLKGSDARLLGLAYWLVGENGPKIVQPASKNKREFLEESARWDAMRDALREWVVTLVKHIRSAEFSLSPSSDDCTSKCQFGQVCRITQARSVDKPWRLELPVMSSDCTNSGMKALEHSSAKKSV